MPTDSQSEKYLELQEGARAFQAALAKEHDTPLGVVTARLAESGLARVWDTPAEDDAWRNL